MGRLRALLSGPPAHAGATLPLGIAAMSLLWAPNFGGASGLRTAAALATCAYLCVVAHEAAHAAVAALVGLAPRRMAINAAGGVTEYAPALRPGQEAAVVAAGPAVNAAVGAGCLLWAHVGAPPLVGPLAVINLLLAAFNLLPGLPLDGGRLLAAAVWRLSGSFYTGQAVAGRAGQVVGAAVVMAPFCTVALGAPADVLDFVLCTVVGAVLMASASVAHASARRGLLVGDLCAGDVCVPGDAPGPALDAGAEYRLVVDALDCSPADTVGVVVGGEKLGVVTRDSLEQGVRVRVGDGAGV